MFKEYAVDPELLGNLNATWMLLDNMGIEHGRLICKFPKKWTRLVYDEIEKSDCPDLEKKNLVERLNKAKRALANLCQHRHYENAVSWLDSALQANSEFPFAAIIVRDELPGSKKTDNELPIFAATNDHPLWNNEIEPIARTRAEIEKCLAPLACISRCWHFIDPYLSSDFKFTNVIFSIIRQCLDEKRPPKEIVLHTSEKAGEFQWLRDSLAKQYSLANVQSKLTLRQWKPREDGEAFHARYFLTERGGIYIDYGLAEGKLGQTTDIGRLDGKKHAVRWRDFAGNSTAYDLIDSHEFTP